MTDFISREFATDLEVRADGSGRTIHGIVVPFDRVARVTDGGPFYNEAIQRGAFKRTIDNGGTNRVKLLSHHNRQANPLGRATLLREDAAGLYGEFRVSQTSAGDEALALVRDGALDSFSVGFRPVQNMKRGDVVWRTEVMMREASLVTFGAYEDAVIGGVRAQFTPNDLAELAQMMREAVPLATPEGDPAGDGTSEPSEPALETSDSDHMAHSQCRNRARMRGILKETA